MNKRDQAPNDRAEHPRMAREARTIEAMIRLYCRGQGHNSGDLCPECRELLEYTQLRLLKCPFQEGKTICARCQVHCSKPVMRERIREVMRYAGPRMLWRHPWLTLLHMLDGLRKEPAGPLPQQAGSQRGNTP